MNSVAGWWVIAAGLLQPAWCDCLTLTQGITAQLAPAAKLAVPATLSLVNSGATFQPFSGTLAVTYRVRTSPAGGGSITLQATSDFAPAGGPSVAAGSLTYACSNATLGTPCGGRQIAGASSQSPVLNVPPGACTGGGAACSATDPNSIQVTFSLDNDSGIGTGNYAAQIMFVISAI
jgi:hypothetical protein